MKLRFSFPAITLMATAQFAGVAAAQDDGAAADLFLFGQAMVPTGHFDDHVDVGGGLGLGETLFLDQGRHVALRAEGTLVVYGNDTYRAPLSAALPINVNLSTTNTISSAGLGPQVYLTSGAFRLYVFGTFGFSYFVTETSVEGDYADEPFLSTVNLDDLTMAVTGGGGFSVDFYRGDSTVGLDVSTTYQHNGTAEYLVESETQGVIGNPIIGDANLMTYRIGIVVRPG